jgi:predicted lipid-binding transport protein (Tim44 family)
MDDWGSLGAPQGTMDTKPGINSTTEAAAQTASSGVGSDGSGGGLLGGLILGIALYFGYQNRELMISKIKAFLPKSNG